MRSFLTIKCAISLVATLALVGCGTFGGGAEQHAARTLTYDDFVRDSVETGDAGTAAGTAEIISDQPDVSVDTLAGDEDTQPGASASSVRGEREPDASQDLIPESDQATLVADGEGEEWRTQAANLKPGQRVMINSLIGEINGRPIYANEFFAPIDSLIRRERERARSLAAFEKTLGQIVKQRMDELVQSELFLAEALSQITPEQQVGLIAWLTQTRERIVRQRTGSVEVARRELQAEGYTGLEDAVADERDKALLRMLLQKEVAPRVIVSWKDVQREYERRFDEFNPPATAVLASIRLVPGEQDDKIEMVLQQLASGVPFTEVAKAAGMRRDGVMRDEPEILGPGGLADVEGLIPLYREKLATMKEGDTVGPFTQVLSGNRGEWRVWLHVVDISQPPGRSIYEPELQMQLKEDLLQRQFFIEQFRYFQRLQDDVLEAEIKKLEDELVEIGKDRYS